MSHSFDVLRRLGEIHEDCPIVGPTARPGWPLGARFARHSLCAQHYNHRSHVFADLQPHPRADRSTPTLRELHTNAQASTQEIKKWINAQRKNHQVRLVEQHINDYNRNIEHPLRLVRGLRPTIVVRTRTRPTARWPRSCSPRSVATRTAGSSPSTSPASDKLQHGCPSYQSDTDTRYQQDYHDHWTIGRTMCQGSAATGADKQEELISSFTAPSFNNSHGLPIQLRAAP